MGDKATAAAESRPTDRPRTHGAESRPDFPRRELVYLERLVAFVPPSHMVGPYSI